MMNQKTLLAIVAVTLAFTPARAAEVTVTEKESPDKSSTRAVVAISTMDRTFVPIIRETKETKVDENTTRTESVTRARAIDGGYVDWLTSSTVERKIGPGVTETSREVVEKDRQGGSRVSSRLVQTVTETPAGGTLQASEYRRNASGAVVLSKQTTAVTKRNPDGTFSTEQLENEVDVNGRSILKNEIGRTERAISDTEKIIHTQVKSFSHLEGRFAVASEETTIVRTVGNRTRTETIVRTPSRSGMTVGQRITTTEVRAPDGTVQRETIEEGRSLFSKVSGADIAEPLAPKWKSVERETRKPDGTVVTQRDVYRRDVNGDWVPVKYSTDTDWERSAGQ
jgi:hypothetical protein